MRNNLIKISLAAAMLFALSACGSGNNSDAPLVDNSGKHPADWARTHKDWIAAHNNKFPVACTGCHDSDLTGGISKVSCMNPAAGCHTTSPALNPTGCVSCHVQGTAPGVPQSNSYYSGNISFNGGVSQVNLHELHVVIQGVKPPCANCHDLNKVTTRHFTKLAPPAPEATAAGTIGGGSTKVTSYTPYTSTVPSGACATTCHVTRNWKN